MNRLFLIVALLLFTSSLFADDKEILFQKMITLAESGNAEAQYHLGMFYNNGIGTNKDRTKAYKWFEKSASSGDPLGQYKLGCYFSGQGEGVIQPNNEMALKYKLAAAEAGYVLAQTDVAKIYYQNQEFDKALSWWKRSANQGDPQSVYALFSLYYGGKGVERDASIALGYLKIIERNTDEKDRVIINEKLRELQNELTSSQIQQAEELAESWRAEQTVLTIKALSGLQESKRLVEKQ